MSRPKRKKRLDVVSKADHGADVSALLQRAPRAGNTNQQRSLRIVMVSPDDPYRRSARFAEELVQRGHQVDFFYAALAADDRRHELPGGCVAHPYRVLQLSDHQQLSRAIAGCDIVHLQKGPQAWLALALALAHGKPIHQDWDDDAGALSLQATRDELQNARLSDVLSLLRTARAALAAGAAIASEWATPKLVDSVGGATMSLRHKAAHRGAARAAIFPARAGVDSHLFSPAQRADALRRELGLDGPTVVYAGSIDVEFFMCALKKLHALQPTARCLVIGTGFDRERLVDELTRAGMRSQVVLANASLPHAERPRYLASSDLAALPFRDNAINRGKSSQTLLECMASGLPVLTHDVGDSAWMLGDGGELGVLDDPNDFGERMARMLFDVAASKKQGAAGRARAETVFSWSGTVDYLEQAYHFAIARHASAGRKVAAVSG